MDLHLRHFLVYLASERGLSSNTLKAYESDIKIFIGGIVIRNDVSEGDLLSFMESLKNKGYHQNSICRIWTSVKLFLRHLQKNEVIQSNVAELWESPKLKAVLPTVLSEEEVNELMDRCEQILDRAILECLYATGIRVSELCALNRCYNASSKR